MTRDEMIEALREPLWAYAMSKALATDTNFNQEEPLVIRAKKRYAKACTDIDTIVGEYVYCCHIRFEES